MATANAMYTSSIPGLELRIEYNGANLRMSRVFWNVPTGMVWARVWDSGVLVIDQIIIGPASGESNIRGNYQMVQAIDDDGSPYLKLPPELTYNFQAHG